MLENQCHVSLVSDTRLTAVKMYFEEKTCHSSIKKHWKKTTKKENIYDETPNEEMRMTANDTSE